MTAKRLTVFVFLLALVTGEVITAQGGRAVIVVRPAGYPGDDYTAKPAEGTYGVFFVGEPIDLVWASPSISWSRFRTAAMVPKP